jgi:ribonucleotide reductase alpha subunit
MEYPFDSPDAAQLNKNIFETIYFAAVTASCELAEKYGPYSTFSSPTPSPAAQGLLQFDLWGVSPNSDANLGPVYDWDSLKEKVKKFGLRNSLLLAPMPTASTAQILGNNESIEPFTSNLYTRSCLSGNFIVVNKHLMKSLIDLGLWNEKMRMQIIAEKGSIQNINNIPQKLKDLYKTVWELKMKTLIDMSADRGAFICQSQSLNMFVAEPSLSKLTSMHFHSWKKGLKTGMYYLRTRPKAEAIQFTVDKSVYENPLESKKTPFSGTDDKNEALKKKAEEAAKKRQAIREAMKNDEFEIEDEMCISCGS